MERKTIFIDIDGTILFQEKDWTNTPLLEELPALSGCPKKIVRWHCDGHMIVLTTARPESMREVTERQLKYAGVIWDKLIMGLAQGPRVLINDITDVNTLKAISYNVLRNSGQLVDIEL